MSHTIQATFRSTSWEETSRGDADAQPKLSRASCTQEYTGEISGKSTLEYVMAYRDGGAATFVGMERIEGTLAGREGSFAIQHQGVYEGGVARMTLTIVEGSGTGALSGLSGSGTFESPHAEAYDVTLTCELPE